MSSTDTFDLAWRAWNPTAPQAVLVHGSSSSSGSWWRIGAELAQRGWNVHAVDLPGHGASAPLVGEPLPEALAGDLVRALPDEPLELLVGHSLGALVALELAARAPDRVRRLVLEEPPGPRSVDGATMADELRKRARAARADPAAKLAEVVAGCPRWHERDCRQALCDLIACDDAYLASGLRRASTWRTVEVAERVAAPALVLLAPDAEGVFDDRADATALRGRERRDLLAALDDPAVQVLDTGHCVHRDDPAAWLAAVDAFLAR